MRDSIWNRQKWTGADGLLEFEISFQKHPLCSHHCFTNKHKAWEHLVACYCIIIDANLWKLLHIVCVPQTGMCARVCFYVPHGLLCVPTCVGWFHVLLIANLLCGCPSLCLFLGLVAMAMRVGRGGEPWKGIRICVWKAHQVWLRNHCTSTSLHPQVNTVCQIRMRGSLQFLFNSVVLTREPLMLNPNTQYIRICWKLGCERHVCDAMFEEFAWGLKQLLPTIHIWLV